MSFSLKGTENLSKAERIDFIKLFIKSQLKEEEDPLALASNISAIIMALMEDLNWVGFYFVKGSQLVLGPFQGLPACTRLEYEIGVCAKAWREKTTIKVDDVHDFPGHVACDSASNSELVIPLIKEGQVFGVLDIDSPMKARFTDLEVNGLEEIVNLVQEKIFIG